MDPLEQQSVGDVFCEDREAISGIYGQVLSLKKGRDSNIRLLFEIGYYVESISVSTYNSIRR